jgi:hypothetical protein
MTKLYKYRVPTWVLELIVAMTLVFGVIVLFRAIAAHAEERATFTDKDGHFAGSSITNGPKTDFYDSRGHYQGTATQQSKDQTRPLGNVDGSKPFGTRLR